MRKLILIFLSLTIVCCSQKTREDDSKRIKAIAFSTHLPFKTDMGTLEEMGSTFNIFYMDSLTIFEMPVFIYDAKTESDKGDSVKLEVDATVDSVSLNYFVFKKGNKKGLAFESSEKLNVFNRVDVAKFLETQGVNDDNLKIFDTDPGILRSESVMGNSGKVVVQKFSLQKKNGSPDSIYRYFDKNLKGVDFTFSSRQDQKMDSKLVKIIFVYNEIPRREVSWEIKSISIPNEEVINKIISQYKLHTKTLPLN